MTYRVDGISDGIARLEDESGALLYFSASSLPPDVRDGSCLRTCGGLLISDPEEEAARRKRVYDLQQRLRDNSVK